MSVRTQTRVSSLYETDFAEWLDVTGRLLREHRFDELDVEHLIEEIEGMSASERHEMNSRVRVVLLHLLKWRYQPEKRGPSWRSTLAVQRIELADRLETSPSLRRSLARSMPKVYRTAVNLASIETGLPAATFPSECPFTPAEVIDPGFLPE
jgi:hypothetical protein